MVVSLAGARADRARRARAVARPARVRRDAANACYPAFLAAVYTIFGENAAAFSLVQIPIGVATVAITFATLGRGGRFFYSHLHDQLRGAKDYVRSLSAGRPLANTLTESEIAS